MLNRFACNECHRSIKNSNDLTRHFLKCAIMTQERSRKILRRSLISSKMKWEESWQVVNSAENFEKSFTKILLITRDNMNLIKIVVETKKFFITNEENVSFVMIDFENDEWSDIDLNDSLNKVVNDERKRLEQTNVAMSSLNLIFMKLTRNAELLSSSTTLKQIIYSKIKNRYAEIEIMKIKKKIKNQSNFYSFLNKKEYTLAKWFYESKLTKNKVDAYF